MKNVEKIKPTGLFTNYIYKAIPLAFDESMSYYETLCGLLSYLKDTVIPTVNNNADAIIEVQSLITQLQDYVDNYFKNLDVQQEINNKLDAMAQDGTLENIMLNYIRLIQPNKNFDLKLGFTSWFHNKDDGGENVLNICNKYFDNMIQAIIIEYDSTNEKFITSSENQNLQNTNINNFIQNGGKLGGIKFHLKSGTTLLSLFQSYTSQTICEKYGTFILNYINNLPYKNSIEKVWILNEGNSAGNDAFTSTYANDIITLINRVKNSGYYVSIPMTPYGINKCDKSIINAINFISINTYPNAYNGFDWTNSTINDVIERYNYDFEICERYTKDKDLYVTEFGCSASWSSFVKPADYYDDGQGKPISLMIEGFYKSKFIANCKGVWLWYFDNAMSYAPYTLTSIKNNTEVRYAK